MPIVLFSALVFYLPLTLHSLFGYFPSTNKIKDTILPTTIGESTQAPTKQTKNLTSSSISEFHEFVPSGYSILAMATDSIPDKILILSRTGEDSLSTPENPIMRIVSFLFGQDKGSYTQVQQHKTLIYFYNYDMNFKEAFAGISITPGFFTISHYGGLTERWSRTTTFKYNIDELTWLLYKEEFSTFNAADQLNTTVEKVLTEKNFGKVYMTNFNIYED